MINLAAQIDYLQEHIDYIPRTDKKDLEMFRAFLDTLEQLERIQSTNDENILLEVYGKKYNLGYLDRSGYIVDDNGKEIELIIQTRNDSEIEESLICITGDIISSLVKNDFYVSDSNFKKIL